MLGLRLWHRGLPPGRRRAAPLTPPEKGNRDAVPMPGDQPAAELQARPCQVRAPRPYGACLVCSSALWPGLGPSGYGKGRCLILQPPCGSGNCIAIRFSMKSCFFGVVCLVVTLEAATAEHGSSQF